MKLYQILNEKPIVTKEEAIEVIYSYTTDWEEEYYLSAAVPILLQYPEYVYTGKMYRTNEVDGDALVQMPDVRMALASLQQYDQDNKRQFFSWSKTIKGMNIAVRHQYPTDYEHPVGVIFEQQGQSLDVTKVLKTQTHEPTEEELLARFHNNINVVGFSFYRKQYDISQFQQLIQLIQSVKADI